jgi:hypothetical protein
MTDNSNALTTTSKLDQTAALIKAAGVDMEDFGGMDNAEVIQSGGVTKWVDLRKFQVNPAAKDKEPVMGNGKAFAGALLSRQEIEVDDDESGEVKADGTKVRFFYLLRLLAPCPVTYKDENKETIEEDAEAGEIVAIGERHHLKPLRELCEDGGLYVLAIKPHSRIKISATRTMWTFDVVKKTLRAPVKMQVIPAKAPF